MKLEEIIAKYPSGTLLRRKDESKEVVKVDGLFYSKNRKVITLENGEVVTVENVERLFEVVKGDE